MEEDEGMDKELDGLRKDWEKASKIDLEGGNKEEFTEKMMKADEKRRKFLAKAIRKTVEHLGIDEERIHDLGTGSDPTTHEELSKVLPDSRYVSYELNESNREELKESIGEGMETEYKGDYNEETETAGLVVSKFPFKEEEVFKAAADHLEQGKTFILGSEGTGVSYEDSKEYFDEMAEKHGFRPKEIPGEVEELHKNAQFYVGAYEKI